MNKQYYILSRNFVENETIITELKLVKETERMFYFVTDRPNTVNFKYCINKKYDINRMLTNYIICDDLTIGKVEFNKYISEEISKKASELKKLFNCFV